MKEIEFLKLGLYEGEIENDVLARKKEFGHIMTQTRKRAKGDRCLHCKEKKSSFCNSHSVPAFCLRNISTNGAVYYSNTLINIPLLDEEKGIKNAGTFQIICKECDSTIFQEYENPDNYEKEATPKMLAQIAMKNFLRHIGKRINDHALYEIIGEKNPLALDFVRKMHSIQDAELEEYKRDYEKAKRLSEINCNEEYYQFYHEKLDYVVPLAFQGSIALVTDLDGEVLNDIYDKDRKYRIQNLHICIFPLKDTSIVMMFMDSNDKRYMNFYKKFNKLSHEDKLSLVNYIVFLYSEDVFLSKEIPDEVLKDKKLVELSQLSSLTFLMDNFSSSIEEAKKIYDLSKYTEIPNLLSEKYKLR
ncbi:hypothetical protein GCM10008904_01200 [Paraclostridium ghonii]|uniref:HNH endonuclease n=1 Tax=Paraclostridium ghonii TaxID=29358 RepID=A0ABU0N428_9FIRM|nr:hypothetical protein [Paeniclostridium ghonii]MDQ0557922.1 hypothetical protein [Paeniclostridium ghonii]